MALVIHSIAAPVPSVKAHSKKHRASYGFEDTELFQASKGQVVKEIDETLIVMDLNRTELAMRMGIQPSAITQFLRISKGLQLTTLVRIAHALDCDIEVNFIRRYSV